MARRVYVRNPRVKGGGYWRNMQISQEGQVVGSGRRRRVKGTPAEEAARGIRNARMQGVQRKGPVKQGDNVRWTSKSGRAMEGTVLKTGKSRKSHTIWVTNSPSPGKMVIEKSRVKRNTGDKQPRSTKPPKSTKPKKTGKVRQPDFKAGRRIKKGSKRYIEPTSSSVKRAQGKKRTLSEAQKAAKRSRAKARRARK